MYVWILILLKLRVVKEQDEVFICWGLLTNHRVVRDAPQERSRAGSTVVGESSCTTLFFSFYFFFLKMIHFQNVTLKAQKAVTGRTWKTTVTKRKFFNVRCSRKKVLWGGHSVCFSSSTMAFLSTAFWQFHGKTFWQRLNQNVIVLDKWLIR